MKTDNELIAEFMGFTQAKSSSGNTWQHPDKMGVYGGTAQKFKYDISWDWLMPVVEKIENIKHIGIDAVYIQMNGCKCEIWTYFDVEKFLRLTGDDKNEGNKFKIGHSAKTKIEATYNAVVDFIKWYNEQTKLPTV